MPRRADRTWLCLLTVVALFSGCAASSNQSPAAPKGLPPPTGKCIFVDTINDWKAVDPYHLLVRTRATGWQWKITLDRRCSDILYANALKWDTLDTRVCDSRADAITVARDRCTIGSIEPYDEPPKVEKKPAGGGW